MKPAREMTLLIASISYLGVAIVSAPLARDLLSGYVAVIVTLILIKLLRKGNGHA